MPTRHTEYVQNYSPVQMGSWFLLPETRSSIESRDARETESVNTHVGRRGRADGTVRYVYRYDFHTKGVTVSARAA